MTIAWWSPTDDRRSHFERPYLEAPSPYDYMPREPPRSECDEDGDDDTPRVIIIEM